MFDDPRRPATTTNNTNTNHKHKHKHDMSSSAKEEQEKEKEEKERPFFDEEPLEIDGNNVEPTSSSSSSSSAAPWKPSGNFWKDAWFFVGPGWLVSIAYIDPGNYQADIQAGSTTRYTLLFAIWWSSLLSIYVQILCVRLAYYAQLTLAEAQARNHAANKWRRYASWFVAEFSTMITDLPEVIGMGIACHYFFGWDYYVGVLLSLLTTMVFLASLRYGIQVLEGIVFCFVGIMSVALWSEMAVVGPTKNELLEGWAYGFVNVSSKDLFSIAGIMGSVVMPHNLYLHTAAIQSRRVQRREDVVRKAVMFSSWEPVLPIMVSFFVNMAVVTIAAESVYGSSLSSSVAANVGLTDFCTYFQSLKGGCLLWGVALLAAGQSSAITTTYTGQYVMDGFLQLHLPVELRAIVTRLVAIAPCVVVSILFTDRLNDMINLVNAALSFLLPFALTPLVKYNCSEQVMGGKEFASTGVEKAVLYGFAIVVWAINAVALSAPGGGFFGDFVWDMPFSVSKLALIALQIVLQGSYAWWNFATLYSPVGFFPRALEEERPPEEQFARSVSWVGESERD
jgi:NRAMP (natural resistance-associated macrophage protein)-like metal ion transporter